MDTLLALLDVTQAIDTFKACLATKNLTLISESLDHLTAKTGDYIAALEAEKEPENGRISCCKHG